MSPTRLAAEVLTVFTVTLIVSVIVSVLWNVGVHRAPTIDWETSFRFAILMAIVLPWMETRGSRRR